MTSPIDRLAADMQKAGLGWLTHSLKDHVLTRYECDLIGAFVAGAYAGDSRPSAQALREMFPAPTPEH